MELREYTIHDRRVMCRTGGAGPVLLLIHGMAGSSSTWKQVMPALCERFTVVAPDLLGHGRSDKSKGDYSLGAYASTLRDLLDDLGHTHATVVGQSMGGGVAMQFAYQYPGRCERLVLVGAGGLGREVNPLLRFLSVPGSEAVLKLACSAPVRNAIASIGGLTSRLGLEPAPAVVELWRSYASLGDDATRQAFYRTLRSMIDTQGQAVSAVNRLHLVGQMPTLIVWGDADPIIPVEHAEDAHVAIEGSRLETFEGVGHYPHCEAPERFVDVLTDFIETTIPTQITPSPHPADHSLRA